MDSFDLSVFEQIAENNWDAIVFADLEGKVLFTNPAADNLYGYSKGELLGQHVDIFNSQVSHDTGAIVQSIIDHGGWSGEIVQRRKDDSTFTAALTVSLIYNSESTPIGYASHSRDISEKQEFLERLNKSKVYYRTLTESLPHVVLEIDREGNILYANRTSVKTREEVMSSTIYDYLPDDRKAFVRDKVTTVFKDDELVKYMSPGVGADPEKEYWYNVSLVPLNANGMIETALMVVEDVTDKVESLRKIENSEAQLSAIINNTHDLILSIDREYNLVQFNDALHHIAKQGFGIDLEPGMSVFKTMVPEAREKLIPLYQKVLTGDSMTKVQSIPTPNGGTVHYETSYNPIYSNGKITGIAIFSRNISERIHSEQKLTTAIKEKELLLEEIHHRLKNNLAMVSGMLQIQVLESNDPKLTSALEDSQSRIKTTALIHEMLYENDSMTAIEFDKYLNRLIREVDRSHRHPDQRIRVQITADEILLNIREAIPCGLILNELLTNSFKHAFAGQKEGWLNVVLTKDQDNITLQVMDSGDNLPKDFDPLKSSSTGMTIIKTLASQLSGDFVASSSPTCFSLTFNATHENQSTDS